MAEASGLMRGKRGLILGVANNRSLAWGIAKACRAQGADVAFTYQGDALKKRVEPLAQEVGARVFGHCDVTEPGHHRRSVRDRAEDLGLARFRRACRRLLRQEGTRRPLCRHHARTTSAGRMLISCYSFAAHRPARREADAGRRLAADADLLRRRKVDSALQRHGRRQGRAGNVGALSRRRSRHQENPRQRHLVRSDQDAGGGGHRRLPLHPRLDRAQCAAAAQR